jgi:hypothetical protein
MTAVCPLSVISKPRQGRPWPETGTKYNKKIHIILIVKEKNLIY